MKEEPVDILDENGKKTGQTMLKSQVHKKGLYHAAVHIWIYNSKGEVLLQLRSPKKILKPNIWDVSIGGHVISGETPLKTAIEEAKEELDLYINPERLHLIGTIKFEEKHPAGWYHRTFITIYALKLDNLKLSDLKLEVDEVIGIKWLSTSQFEKDLNDPVVMSRYSITSKSNRIAIQEIPKLLEQRK